MPSPSPADYAAQLATRNPRFSNATIETALRKTFAGVVLAVEQLGANLSLSIRDWIDRDGVEAVSLWTSPATADSVIATLWKNVGPYYASRNLLATLVQEQQLSRRGAEIGSYLRSDKSSFAAAIVEVRRHVAQALSRHAYETPFHRPIVLTRTLELSREYLKALLDSTDSSDDVEQSRLGRELGRVIVTMSRFSKVPESDLELALDALRPVCREPGTKLGARTHFLQACVGLYHLSGDRRSLEEAAGMVRLVEADRVLFDYAPWHLSVAEVWLALSAFASSPTGRTAFLSRARIALRLCAGLDLDLTHEIHFKMLSAFVDHVEERTARGLAVVVRNVRFPFGLRTSADRLPSSFFEASDRIIEALQPAADRGKYAYRDALAELHSSLARENVTSDVAIGHLREAVRLRQSVADKNALEGPRTALAQAEDLFMLEALAQKQADAANRLDARGISYRARGVNILVAEAADGEAADPLILLAREVEARGPVASAHTSLDLDLLTNLRSGNSNALYAMAATRAMRSHDIRRRDLGGRGGVVTVEDYAGLTGQTFVFKTTSAISLARDAARALEIGALLSREGLSSRFGVIEHITSTRTVGATDFDEEGVQSVRRFANGRTLRDALIDTPESETSPLDATVQFLAFFHAKEGVLTSTSKYRTDMRQRELGKWLRHLVSDGNRAALLKSWHDITSRVPLVRRRDAHTLNWLVDEDGRVLAVDLESHGSRPLAYELAQLTDDFPVIDPFDLPARRVLFDTYTTSLAEHAVEINLEVLWETYLASLAARAVALLTDSNGNDDTRLHGFRLLQRLEQADIPNSVAKWSTEVARAWRRKAGLVDTDEIAVISQGARRRISKAMAFHLRHDPTAETSRGGWMYSARLAELLTRSGHKVTAAQLLIVAGAMGEARFQLDNDEIRATYGHSTGVAMAYQSKNAPEFLYHATPLSNLRSIFEARAGLTAMSRQMVHMSEDISIAQLTAIRWNQPYVVLRFRASIVDGLVFAANKTWLAPKIRAMDLEVMTIREVIRESPSSPTTSSHSTGA